LYVLVLTVEFKLSGQICYNIVSKFILKKEVNTMCYNCGCQEPDDPMGRGKISEGGASLTEDDLKLIAEKWEMSLKDTKKNILTLLQKTLED
jgi:hypothetical protein